MTKEQEIRQRCEQDGIRSECIYPRCDGCGFDRDRRRQLPPGRNYKLGVDGVLHDASRVADPALVRTREFDPTQEQILVINALYGMLGRVCDTPEDAIALLTFAMTDYIQRIVKNDKLPEAIETLIECIRINTGQNAGR